LGNDFLPHSPSLHIREGSIDAILAIYKNQLPFLDDYLTYMGNINFNLLEIILKDLGEVEEVFMRQKKE